MSLTIEELENKLGIVRDNAHPDYFKWQENCFVNANSHSLNPKVVLLYREILENELSDSEYWTSGHGNECVAEILSTFNSKDWRALEADLSNWTLYQLRLFCTILTAVYDQGSIADSIVIERSYTYGYIITIVDILSSIGLMGDFDFLREGGAKPKALLDKLNSIFHTIEVTPLIVGDGIDSYLRKERFDYLKAIMAELIAKDSSD